MTVKLPHLRRSQLVWILSAAAFIIVALVVGTALNNSATPLRSGAGARPATSAPVPTAQPGGTASSPAPFAAIPPSAGPRTTTEVEAGGTTHHGLPRSKPAGDLFTGPAPKSRSANGALVRGFPSTIPLATGTRVDSSSVSSSGSVVQVSLVARTTLTSSSVGKYYTRAFEKLGIPARPAPADPGSTSYSFVRGKDTVTITVTPASRGSRYSVFGVLHAAS